MTKSANIMTLKTSSLANITKMARPMVERCGVLPEGMQQQLSSTATMGVREPKANTEGSPIPKPSTMDHKPKNKCSL